jgi:hypothetical protein
VSARRQGTGASIVAAAGSQPEIVFEVKTCKTAPDRDWSSGEELRFANEHSTCHQHEQGSHLI